MSDSWILILYNFLETAHDKCFCSLVNLGYLGTFLFLFLACRGNCGRNSQSLTITSIPSFYFPLVLPPTIPHHHSNIFFNRLSKIFGLLGSTTRTWYNLGSCVLFSSVMVEYTWILCWRRSCSTNFE